MVNKEDSSKVEDALKTISLTRRRLLEKKDEIQWVEVRSFSFLRERHEETNDY